MPGPDRTRPLHPPLAKAAQGPIGAFGALLSIAVEDPATARGLALAYASLEPRHRMEIVDAVLRDADAEGIGASAVLASLLPVEDDVTVARHIARAMTLAGDRDLHHMGRARAFLAGSELDGGAMLVRPLHGAFVEVLALAWNDAVGITHSAFDPMAHHADARASECALPERLHFEEIPLGFAIDTVTVVLWNHRRLHRTMPECVEHFADMFSIGCASEVESRARV